MFTKPVSIKTRPDSVQQAETETSTTFSLLSDTAGSELLAKSRERDSEVSSSQTGIEKAI